MVDIVIITEKRGSCRHTDYCKGREDPTGRCCTNDDFLRHGKVDVKRKKKSSSMSLKDISDYNTMLIKRAIFAVELVKQ